MGGYMVGLLAVVGRNLDASVILLVCYPIEPIYRQLPLSALFTYLFFFYFRLPFCHFLLNSLMTVMHVEI